jgi:hypothetical protein
VDVDGVVEVLYGLDQAADERVGAVEDHHERG